MRPDESFVAQPVRSLQQMLRVIGEDRGQSTSVIPDGFYGQQTRGAVAGFQRSVGLPITGVDDQNTHATAMVKDAEQIVNNVKNVVEPIEDVSLRL